MKKLIVHPHVNTPLLQPDFYISSQYPFLARSLEAAGIELVIRNSWRIPQEIREIPRLTLDSSDSIAVLRNNVEPLFNLNENSIADICGDKKFVLLTWDILDQQFGDDFFEPRQDFFMDLFKKETSEHFLDYISLPHLIMLFNNQMVFGMEGSRIKVQRSSAAEAIRNMDTRIVLPYLGLVLETATAMKLTPTMEEELRLCWAYLLAMYARENGIAKIPETFGEFAAWCQWAKDFGNVAV